MTRSRIGVLALARQTFDVPYAEELTAAAFDALEKLDVELLGARDLLFDADSTQRAVDDLASIDLDLLLVMQVTFTDASMMEVIGEAITAPIALWGFPEPRLGGRLRLNAFCGINLAAYALRQLGRGYRYLHHSPDADDIGEALAALFGAADLIPRRYPVPDLDSIPAAAADRADAVRDRLAGVTIAVIGDHPIGFDPCGYDADEVGELLGVTVERLELEDLFASARAVDPALVAATRDAEADRLTGIDQVDQDELARSLSLFPALAGLAAASSYAGLAVRCWPEAFTEFGGAVCAPAALMNDEGTPTSCEADVYGTLSALILQSLSGEAALVADLVDMDPASDTGVLWHCGKGPLSMADPAATPLATVHSNRRKPLLHEYPFKPGRITIARLTRTGGRHGLIVGGGEMLSGPLAYSGTAGVVRFDTPLPEVMDTIMREGLDHHYGFTYGEVRPELEGLAARLGIPIIPL
jgi:L-fucose isomerase-like protein